VNDMNQELLSRPGNSACGAATAPHNSTTAQKPAVVAHPHSAEEVAEAFHWAADQGGLYVATPIATYAAWFGFATENYEPRA
jgi:hypothetical protein